MRGALGRLALLWTYPAIFFGGQWLLGIHIPGNLTGAAQVATGAYLLAALLAGVVVHELGHALAIRLAGERVLGVDIGGRLGRRPSAS